MTLGLDLRQAVRLMAKNPGFSSVAVLTLALGIGANTAIFSVVNSVLLEPLRYRDADRIVSLSTRFQDTGRVSPRLAGGDLVDVRASATAFEAISYCVGGELGIQLQDRAEFTRTFLVTSAFFRVYGLQPVFGRLFEDSEAERSAVVSLSFAERNFGSGGAAVGQKFGMENRVYEITGVLPAGFHYPPKAEVWVSARATPFNTNRTAYNYPALGKLSGGTSMEAAQAQLDTIAARLAAAHPESNREKRFAAVALRDQLVNPIRSTLIFLLAAVSLVLLIACANVANLLLARAAARSREMAVRCALGAGRWRIVRQLAAESLLLAVAGGALGLVLADTGVDLLARIAPDNLPRMNEVSIDRTVLAFTLGISVIASLLFGLAPAWQASRTDLSDALKQGGSRGLLGGRSHRMQNALVVAEISLSCVLAIGAGLLFRSFVALNSVQLGFQPEGLMVMYAHVPAKTLDDHRRATRSFEQLLQQLAAIPGVRSAAAAMGLPAGRYGSNGMYAVEGKHELARGQDLPQSGFRLATPGYFATMGIPLIAGRDFSPRDEYDSPFVAVISESLARQSFPDEDPLGRRIQCGLDSPRWMTIVGVVGDVRSQSPESAPGPELYMPVHQHPYYANELQVVLRTSAPPAGLMETVRRKTAEADPAIAAKFTTMEAMLADSIATPRFRMFLTGIFAALALLLASAGIHGLMAYVVAQRTAEFGLRSALGANPAGIVKLVLRRAAALTACGLAIGLAVSLASGRILATMLFGLEPADAATYAVVLPALTLAALCSAGLPALRAAKIDPLKALREE